MKLNHLVSGMTALLLLAGCAGTAMTAKGNVCGQPVDLELIDRKDRSSFTVSVTCPGGGSLNITTADSSTSSVVSAMSDLVRTVTGLIEKLALAAPK